MKTLPVMIALAVALAAQPSQPIRYVATTGNVSLSSAATAATLQQPSTGGIASRVFFPSDSTGGAAPAGASVYCSAACVATLAVNCTTPASATAGTVQNVNPGQSAPWVQFFTASNASSCTTLRVINVAAGVDYAVDLSAVFLPGTPVNTSNITISVASVTATVNITFYPMEAH